jgi:branched-chain amino acid transport system ATP-binding protein
MAERLVEARGLHTYYGASHILRGIDFHVDRGETIGLMGRNGMGKSTLVRSVLGFTSVTAGSVHVAGKDVTRWPSHRVARCGIGWVPEGRQAFAALTLEENLLVAARRGAWNVGKVYELFPRLAERKHHYGNQISGGEQQMLAIGRALLTQPALLVLDEATEGLAPLVRQEIWRTLSRLKESGQSVLIIDRDFDALARLAERFAVMEKGRVVHRGPAAELHANRALIEGFVGV